MKGIEIIAGRLLCGVIRDFLDTMKFMGEPIEYIESRGIIERTFMVKGDEKSITTIRGFLKQLSEVK